MRLRHRNTSFPPDTNVIIRYKERERQTDRQRETETERERESETKTHTEENKTYCRDRSVVGETIKQGPLCAYAFSLNI